jgi:DNA-binding NarL/FixJ family response regulator
VLGESRLRVGVLAKTGITSRRVAALLERDGFEVAARVSTPRELTAPRRPLNADACVVVSEQVGERSGWLRQVAESMPNVPIVAVAASASRREIRDALAAGASGFVDDQSLEERLVPTVQAVCAGQLAVPADFREAVARPRLSPREKQILGMVVMGFSNGEIAGKLFIAETTVKSHLSSAFQKLGVRSRSEATALILDSDGGLGTGILAISEERS